MNRSAFSDMKLTRQSTTEALDQRLFAPQPARVHEDEDSRAHERAHVASLPHDNARTEERANVTTPGGDGEIPDTPAPPRAHTESASSTLVPANATGSQRPEARLGERHSHDIFKDQVRWMNRLKLDLEERYGAKITANAMVQLALDLLRDDFKRHGERSHLITVLVQGHDWQAGHDAADAGEEGTP